MCYYSYKENNKCIICACMNIYICHVSTHSITIDDLSYTWCLLLLIFSYIFTLVNIYPDDLLWW